MSIAFVQANNQLSPNIGPVSSVSIAFHSDTPAHAIGLCWIWNSEGGGLTGVTDTDGNQWCSYTGKDTNATGFGNMFVCLDLAAGLANTNTVTASGVFTVDGSGGPIIQIAQFSAPSGSYVLAAQPTQIVPAQTHTGYGARIAKTGATLSGMLVAGFYDNSGISHSWAQLSGTQISLDTIFVETNNYTGCMAYGPISTQANLNVFSATATTLNMFFVIGCIIVEP